MKYKNVIYLIICYNIIDKYKYICCLGKKNKFMLLKDLIFQNER